MKSVNIEPPMNELEARSLARLIEVAQGYTGQSRIVANFLLAWWNASFCGGYALNDMWGLDAELVEDVKTVFAFICRKRMYPNELGLLEEFEALVRRWRPEQCPPLPVWNELSATDGQLYPTRVVTCSNAPGYRDINIQLAITDPERKVHHIEIHLQADDAIDLMEHVREVNRTAWSRGSPIDVKQDEQRPHWLR
jgi:hypothetical protein